MSLRRLSLFLTPFSAKHAQERNPGPRLQQCPRSYRRPCLSKLLKPRPIFKCHLVSEARTTFRICCDSWSVSQCSALNKVMKRSRSSSILKHLETTFCVQMLSFSLCLLYSFFSSGLWRLKWWIIMDYLWLFVIFYPTCSTTSPESKDCAPWAQIQWSELFASLYIHLHAADRPEEPSDVQKHI